MTQRERRWSALAQAPLPDAAGALPGADAHPSSPQPGWPGSCGHQYGSRQALAERRRPGCWHQLRRRTCRWYASDRAVHGRTRCPSQGRQPQPRRRSRATTSGSGAACCPCMRRRRGSGVACGTVLLAVWFSPSGPCRAGSPPARETRRQEAPGGDLRPSACPTTSAGPVQEKFRTGKCTRGPLETSAGCDASHQPAGPSRPPG